MRYSHWRLLCGFAVCFSFLVGCGDDSGPAQPAVQMDEIQQFLADNPDQNTDDLDEEMEDEEEDL